MIAPGVLVAAVTVLVGWVALLPLRERLGTLGYHVCAIPVGVLGWSVVASVSMALRSSWTPLLVVGSLIAWCAFVWLAWRYIARQPMRLGLRMPALHYLYHVLFFGGVVAFAMFFARLGVSAFSADGWSQYEPDGMILQEIGRTSPRVLGNRMVSVSALHAAYHFFGGEFTHVVQPVLGLATALLVAAGIWWGASGRIRPLPRMLIAVLPVLAMASNAVYAFHSVYLHSHMVSALFLILAIVALMRGFDRDGIEPAWLLVAGLGTAGIVLARPDGAAYAVVPIMVAAALSLRFRASQREVDAYFGPLLATSVLVIAGSVVQLGNWWTRKLSLQTLLLFLGVYAVVWLAVRFLSSDGRLEWLKAGTNSLRLIVALDFAALLVVVRVWAETVMRSVSNMASNLLETGGYRFFWPFVASSVVISLSLRPRSARHRFTAYALFAIVQFMVIAFVLHGIRHPGRIGWGDSFTRVSFQIMPVIYLYIGLYLGEVTRALKRER